MYGFYDPTSLPESPSVPFTPAIIDFPDSVTYGTWYSGTTSFNVTSMGLDLDVDYAFTGFASAYGTVTLPGSLGPFECIQVKYDEECVYNWESIPIQQSDLKSYYYLTREAGTSVILTSLESDTPPPDAFTVA